MTDQKKTTNDCGPDGTGWACDRCGELIQRATEGILEWLPDNEGPWNGRRMRIVHSWAASPLSGERKCGRADWTMSGLDGYVGADGLVQLLAFIIENPVPTEDIFYTIQRLHVPHYEQARRHIDSALAEGIIQPPNLPKGFYWQEQLESVLARYGPEMESRAS